MPQVTISVKGVDATVQVKDGTTEEMVKEAFEKLYPHQEGIIEYTLFKNPRWTKQQVEDFRKSVRKELDTEALVRGFKSKKCL